MAATATTTATTLFSYWRSSSSYRVRIALHWKEIAFAYKAVHLVRGGGEQLSDAYAAVNPLRQVPALEIDGTVIVESQGAHAFGAWRCVARPCFARCPALLP